MFEWKFDTEDGAFSFCTVDPYLTVHIPHIASHDGQTKADCLSEWFWGLPSFPGATKTMIFVENLFEFLNVHVEQALSFK